LVFGSKADLEAQKYPSVFPPGSHFDRFPYALPCYISALLSLLGFLTGLFFLKETKKKKEVETEEKKKLVEEEEMTEFEESMEEEKLQQIVELQNQDDKKVSQSVLLSLVRDKTVMTVITVYAFLSLAFGIYNDIYSLWIILPTESGGLSFDTTDIGIVLAIEGVSLVFFQIIIYPRIVEKLGNLRTFQLGSAFSSISIFALPFSSFLAFPSWTAWILVIVIGIIKAWAAGTAFSSIFPLIANTTSASNTGSVNGLAQMGGALARAVGPTLGGVLFAWSSSNGLPFPLNFHFVFNLIAIFCLFNILLTLTLSKNIDKRKEQIEIE